MPQSDLLLLRHVVFEGIYWFTSPGRRMTSLMKGNPAMLLVIMAGEYESAVAGPGGRSDVIRASAGDVVYRPKGDVRIETSNPRAPLQCYVLSFRWEQPVPMLPLVVRDRSHLIRLAAKQLLLLRSNQSALAAAIGHGYLMGLLAEYVRLGCADDPVLEVRVAEYVEAHLKERIGLADLARHVGLEPHYFCRKFKAVAGQAPMRRVRRIRLEYARGMLGSTPRYTLAQIARRVGLANGNQLSRLLKAEFGVGARLLRPRN